MAFHQLLQPCNRVVDLQHLFQQNSRGLNYSQKGMEPSPSGPDLAYNEVDCENSMEYAVEIYLWQRHLERKYFGFNPLAMQPDVTPDMRRVLLDWLMAVNRQFNFSLDTLCLAINFLDRFLQVQPISRECLQLIGLTAFFLASKIEELEPPDIKELVSVCAHCYTEKQFRQTEHLMLTRLRFELQVPTAAFFLSHLVEVDKLGSHFPMAFAHRILESCLSSFDFAMVLPSSLAHAIFSAISEHFRYDGRIHSLPHGARVFDQEVLDEYVKRVTIVLQARNVYLGNKPSSRMYTTH